MIDRQNLDPQAQMRQERVLTDRDQIEDLRETVRLLYVELEKIVQDPTVSPKIKGRVERTMCGATSFATLGLP